MLRKITVRVHTLQVAHSSVTSALRVASIHGLNGKGYFHISLELISAFFTQPRTSVLNKEEYQPGTEIVKATYIIPASINKAQNLSTHM